MVVFGSPQEESSLKVADGFEDPFCYNHNRKEVYGQILKNIFDENQASDDVD